MGLRASLLCKDPEIEPEAKPCPFCGGPAAIQYWHGGKLTKRHIGCANACDVSPGVTGETRVEALNSWNTRG